MKLYNSASSKTLLALAVALWLAPGCSAKSSDTRKELSSEGLEKAASGLPEGARTETKSGKPELAPPLPTLEDPHFAAFDLLVNRPLAHRVVRADVAPAVSVDATAPDFVRYIHGNHANDWMLGEKLDGALAAAVKARKASLWVPALRPGATHELRMRVFNPAKWENKLTVAVNGSALQPVALAEGWQTISIEVPADSKLRADNELALSFSNLGRIDGRLSGGAIAWVELGRQASGAPTVEDKSDPKGGAKEAEGQESEGQESEGQEASAEAGEAGAGKAGAAGGERAADKPDGEPDYSPSKLPLAQDKLQFDKQNGLAWYVWLPEQAKLDLALRAREGCGVSAEVFVEDESNGVSSAVAETRNLVLGRGESQQTAIDLSKWSGQVARLELRASDACQEEVTVEKAALVVPGEQPKMPEGVEPPKRIIVWMIDTLRSDYLPIHFDSDVEAPNLQKLADEGASFKVAYVQGNESRTSHAAFFTGQYPNKNGLVGKGILRPHHHLIQEAVKEKGYKTGCHVANGYVSRNGGFAQGWDHYVNNLRDGWRIDGEGIAKHGVDWAKKTKDDPFFLYLGSIDPHVTYRAHDDLIGKYEKEPYHGKYKRYLSGEELGKIKGGKPVSERDKQRIINLYKNEITFNDRAFGKLRKDLEEAGLWEGTMVIVTSDHGEEFWEHGSVGHGHNVHQELVHVPILLYYPPLIPGGTKVEAGVDVVDIYPTVMDALGAERPDDLQGKSMIPLIHNLHGGYPEPAIATQYKIHYAMQMQQWKLYLKRGDYELYDRNADHFEKKDVSAKHPLASRFMLDAMGWFRAHRKEWDKATWGVPSKVAPGFMEKVSGAKSD
ncbi:sulfatase [Persicimonas caeni]|uniref:Sulfatase n=1 Tax=Persicimonas caeni TaxID=2292766 RepID=A0A4Y6Q191_PERCE|nr:sulfatase [Persicimonas caeni]QDG54313.1 sulfatase [Persicimonas caeni]QED35534.1 sulfatase [Persicimonas caeni]